TRCGLVVGRCVHRPSRQVDSGPAVPCCGVVDGEHGCMTGQHGFVGSKHSCPGGRYSATMSDGVRVIPCLDLDAGRVVKGVNFTGLRDAGDPVELARAYVAAGADEVTLLDVTASADEHETTVDVIRAVAAEVPVP